MHAYGIANLVTEMMHNFVDGISLGIAWRAGDAAGVASTIAVAVGDSSPNVGLGLVARCTRCPRRAFSSQYTATLYIKIVIIRSYTGSSHASHTYRFRHI